MIDLNDLYCTAYTKSTHFYLFDGSSSNASYPWIDDELIVDSMEDAFVIMLMLNASILSKTDVSSHILTAPLSITAISIGSGLNARLTLIDSADPTLMVNNSVFSAKTAIRGGSGIYFQTGQIQNIRCVFLNNRASVGGGSAIETLWIRPRESGNDGHSFALHRQCGSE